MSPARDIERTMLERCLQIATTPGDMPRDQAEANVCRLAGMIVRIRCPAAGARLSDAAATYFADHPEQQVPSAEVVRRGWCRFQKATAPVHWVGRTECIGLLTRPVQ